MKSLAFLPVNVLDGIKFSSGLCIDGSSHAKQIRLLFDDGWLKGNITRVSILDRDGKRDSQRSNHLRTEDFSLMKKFIWRKIEAPGMMVVPCFLGKEHRVK